MSSQAIQQRILHLFANILDYPGHGLAETVGECEALVSRGNPEAATLLDKFCTFVKETPPGRLEEVYTGAFDLDAACYPYVGYHLFGESYKRSAFILELKERYRAQGFAVGNELPDHLAVLLRFLATSDDVNLAGELINEALLPALERMVGESEEAVPSGGDREHHDHRNSRKVYQQMLQALRLVLKQHEHSAISYQPSVVGE